MNEPRIPRKTSSRHGPREQRLNAAIVAQYLNKLAGRRRGLPHQAPAEARP